MIVEKEGGLWSLSLSASFVARRVDSHVRSFDIIPVIASLLVPHSALPPELESPLQGDCSHITATHPCTTLQCERTCSVSAKPFITAIGGAGLSGNNREAAV